MTTKQQPDQHWKFLGSNGEALQGKGRWLLPHDGKPGQWMPKVDNPKLCVRGYHATTVNHLSHFIDGGLLARVELQGVTVKGTDKVAAEQGRILECWSVTDRTWRLLACNIAERVLPIFEAARPDDVRPRQAIEVARRFADGQASANAAKAAAYAARAAASAAAYAAYAANAAHAAHAAAHAAANAARAAAYAANTYVAYVAAANAARAAAYAAAAYADAYAYADYVTYAYAANTAAERLWQGRRIIETVTNTLIICTQEQ